MVDVFEEVEEQLRSDHYRTLALKSLPWVAAGLVAGLAVAGGVWGWRNYQLTNTQKASEGYNKALETMTGGDPSRAFVEFDEVVKSSSGAYKALALMQEAGIRIDQNRVPDAVKLFDAAADVDPEPIIADAARLKSAFALMDSATFADTEARLKPLMEDKRPYRAVAREALAMAKLNAGRVKEARGDFTVLSVQPDAPDDVRQRASAALQLIDSGTAATLPATVKAALSLPPQAQPPVPNPATPGGAAQ